MRDALIVKILSVLPRERLARCMGWGARLRLPRFLQQALLRWYVRHYRVNLAEAEGRLEDYGSLEDFFVRPLKPGVRPVCPDPDAVVSPADAVVAGAGRISADAIPQGGPWNVRLGTLLGDVHPFEGGEYVVLYLSPPDYHRVHVPREGRATAWSYHPGRLFPVFPACAARVEDLFARNERVVVRLETDAGRVALVMVGAFGVGRISLTIADVLTNAGRPGCRLHLEPPVVLERGAELGRFHLGSTVILLFEPGRVRLQVQPGQRVRVGELLARVEAG